MSSEQRQLGRYELLHRIAQGGMGEIYLAKARGAGGFEKNVIIKTILPHLAEEEEFVEKFLDEGRIVVQLVHGNIVPVFDMGEEAHEYFIAMEYIPGRDLREVIKRAHVRGKPMPVPLALHVASEALKGLHYAHQKKSGDDESLGIIHRDISPSNILISSEGDVKIIDFGIARAATRLSKTVSGRLQGKFCYMSPEQASGKEVDSRSDVFSLGVSLYELMTGFRPFEGQSDLESLDLVRKCEFDPPSTLNAEIPDEVDEIVSRALSRDLDNRYESAEKMQVDILQYLYSSGTAPTGTDVAAYLADLFPEGLERKELRSARGSGSTQNKVSLDDVLDAGIDALLGGGDPIDPQATTALGSGSSVGSNPSFTATQHHAPATTSEDSVPSVISVVTPAPGQKRSFAGAIAIGILVGAALAVWYFGQTHHVPVTIKSDPTGADVWLDGARVVGAKTPYTFDLEEGTHQIRLELDGHEPLVLSIPIREDDEAKTIDATSGAALTPISGPRLFTVHTDPADTKLFKNTLPLGDAPQAFELGESDVANIRAVREGCRPAAYTLSYTHPSAEVVLQLDCQEAVETPEPVEVVEPTTNNDVAAKVRVVFDSVPSGAEISINGTAAGDTPVERTFAANDLVSVEVSKAGYNPAKLSKRARNLKRRTLLTLTGAPEGCLNLSVVNPQIADVSIDGGPFQTVARVKRGIKLTAGNHTIVAKNDAAEKTETKQVSIEADSKCATLILFEN